MDQMDNKFIIEQLCSVIIKISKDERIPASVREEYIDKINALFEKKEDGDLGTLDNSELIKRGREIPRANYKPPANPPSQLGMNNNIIRVKNIGEQIKFEVEKLNPEDDDVVVIELQENYPHDVLDNILKSYKEAVKETKLENLKVLIVEDGIDISLLKEEDMCKHGWINKERLQKYLDHAIMQWRKKKENAKTEGEKLMASCYVDAFQCVRISMLGKG